MILLQKVQEIKQDKMADSEFDAKDEILLNVLVTVGQPMHFLVNNVCMS